MYIELTKGLRTAIDDESAHLVSGDRWITLSAGRAHRYAARMIKDDSDGRVRYILMHRVLTNAPAGMVVDHIDGDGLNNRSANLRVCTHAENMRNRRWSGNGAMFKGVTYDKISRNFRSECQCDNKRYSGGRRLRAEDAAKDYDDMAIRLHGEFALTNSMLGLI